jgi:hypothetical protein
MTRTFVAALAFVAASLGSGFVLAGQSGDTTPDNPTVMPPPQAPGGAASHGVITPPAVGDSAINKGVPAPSEFPTPVVPPPGTPGGNQKIVPK